MSRYPDLREFLARWPYDPGQNVRIVRGGDGRHVMFVRQAMGIEEYEVDGRPDGLRPHGVESALDFQLGRLAAAKSAGAEEAFRLAPKFARSCLTKARFTTIASSTFSGPENGSEPNATQHGPSD
jgi:hypothetical protein